MSRDNKFRVWNSVSKEMTYFDTMFFTCLDHPKIGFENVKCSKIMIGGYTEPMQFTGLHDKNRREIWEGDVICIANNHKYEVRYSTGHEFDYEWYGGCFCLFYYNKRFIPFDNFAIKQGEVVGNIHENPELLK